MTTFSAYRYDPATDRVFAGTHKLSREALGALRAATPEGVVLLVQTWETPHRADKNTGELVRDYLRGE